MRKQTQKPGRRKIVLRLPDLDHAKSSVLNPTHSVDPILLITCKYLHVGLRRFSERLYFQ
jgi:hypothetical protein